MNRFNHSKQSYEPFKISLFNHLPSGLILSKTWLWHLLFISVQLNKCNTLTRNHCHSILANDPIWMSSDFDPQMMWCVKIKFISSLQLYHFDSRFRIGCNVGFQKNPGIKTFQRYSRRPMKMKHHELDCHSRTISLYDKETVVFGAQINWCTFVYIIDYEPYCWWLKFCRIDGYCRLSHCSLRFYTSFRLNLA